MNPPKSSAIISNLLSKGRSNQISRRQFIQSMVATGATVSSASMLWSTDVSAQTPNKGGKLRAGIAHGATSDSTDPATWENGFELARDIA